MPKKQLTPPIAPRAIPSTAAIEIITLDEHFNDIIFGTLTRKESLEWGINFGVMCTVKSEDKVVIVITSKKELCLLRLDMIKK